MSTLHRAPRSVEPRSRPASAGGGATRLGLALLVASGLVVGGWAELAPREFYASFPGLGREWLTPLGPFNEHLVRDVGALNLALAAYALARPTRELVRAVGVTWTVWAALHLAYHVTMLGMFGTLDNVLTIASLAGVAAIAAVIAVRPPTT